MNFYIYNIITFLVNLIMNHHLLKLDLTYTDLENGTIILLVILAIHLVALFIFGLVKRNDEDIITPLYVVVYLIYTLFYFLLDFLNS